MSQTPAPVSLRRTWITSMLQLVAIIAALGAVALVVTTYSRSTFRDTTSDVEAQMNSLASMRVAMIEMSMEATPVMYAFETDVPADEQFTRYLEAADRVTAEFEEARSIFTDATSTDLLESMSTLWQQIDPVVRAAPELRDSGAVAELLGSAADPYETTVWWPYRQVDMNMASLGVHAADQLGTRISRVDQMYRLIAPAVLLGLGFALVLSWGAARRLSRRVISPLEEVRAAATAMRASHLDRPLELRHAASELHDLANAINDTAIALRSTHDLLRDQAETDPLTGLPNRRAFTELLEQELGSGATHRLAVLFIDLDDFKVVNDTLGHAAGDELLRIVARRLRAVAREGETVARLGGDEFAIVVHDAESSEGATALADRVLEALGERVVIDGSVVPVACSIGIALSSGVSEPDEADETLRNADFAMYMAKSQGKNRFELFAPTMHTEMVAAMELKHDLGQAVLLDQFELEYQPVLDLHDRRLLGFEALVRWRHPARGLLPPSAFIPLAEDTTDIVGIGRWVLDHALAALAEHQRNQPRDAAPLWMSVNVSPVEIGSGLVASVRDALERHDVPASTLVIEITEGVAMAHSEQEAVVLRQLRELGVHIALDDFGTGFASLRMLHDLPVDVIKIDRSFLSGAAGEASAGRHSADSMLEVIVAMGRSLGLDIIAEGIETPAELERLARFGIAGQGFLFAHPMSSSAATEYREHATRSVATALR